MNSPAHQKHPRTLVMKFGGTSVGSAGAIQSTVDIIREMAGEWDRLVIVVSAIRGVTGALLDCAHHSASGNNAGVNRSSEWVFETSAAAVRDLFPDSPVRHRLQRSLDAAMKELDVYLRRIAFHGRVEPELLDAVSSLGERINARIVSAQIGQTGIASSPVDATGLIVTDRNFMNAAPLQRPTRRVSRRALAPLFAAGAVPVVTGFIGATRDGRITTLGRGGSDYTATILGASLDAKEVWIWTDVAGVMTADPRLVPEAGIVNRLRYAEVHELANFGGRVLHPKTVLPVRRRGIPVRVRHTFDPDFRGTLISDTQGGEGADDLIVTLLQGCRWHGQRHALVSEPGPALIPVRLKGTVPSFSEPVSVISLVGRTACAGELKEGAYRSLAHRDVAVYATAQTRARNRFSVVVPAGQAPDALRAVHNAVVLQ